MELVIVAVIALVGLFSLAWIAERRRRRKREAVRAGTAQLATALRRAAAPIPELLDSVGDYAAYERAVFAEVRAAAEDAQRASAPEEAVGAHDRLLAALGDLFAIIEVYPDLVADDATATRLRTVENALADASHRRAELTSFVRP
ncbi:LemA family protein [Aeromicrobium sp. YIM 150415]|uniref:LemA family protein n=1 Tax=Aeromicrobium sp. YIM 150415 TaxID=2803912 RepID=UPI00196617A7|nr:LemA family protein [Aeromicrobium sp. YIM 150415]MBM9464891.1 LemA family protein [Aeromicrobium sp. YIM 150415]